MAAAAHNAFSKLFEAKKPRTAQLTRATEPGKARERELGQHYFVLARYRPAACHDS